MYRLMGNRQTALGNTFLKLKFRFNTFASSLSHFTLLQNALIEGKVRTTRRSYLKKVYYSLKLQIEAH